MITLQPEFVARYSLRLTCRRYIGGWRIDEIKRIFPNPESWLRAVRRLCAETHEACLTHNRHINMDLLKEQMKPSMTIAA